MRLQTASVLRSRDTSGGRNEEKLNSQNKTYYEQTYTTNRATKYSFLNTVDAHFTRSVNAKQTHNNKDKILKNYGWKN